MQIQLDTEYNEKYPTRPRRFTIIEEDGIGPVYVTEDALPAIVTAAEAKVTKWQDIQTAIEAM